MCASLSLVLVRRLGSLLVLGGQAPQVSSHGLLRSLPCSLVECHSESRRSLGIPRAVQSGTLIAVLPTPAPAVLDLTLGKMPRDSGRENGCFASKVGFSRAGEYELETAVIGKAATKGAYTTRIIRRIAGASVVLASRMCCFEDGKPAPLTALSRLTHTQAARRQIKLIGHSSAFYLSFMYRGSVHSRRHEVAQTLAKYVLGLSVKTKPHFRQNADW